ncbi:type II toxin-antitoxin system death-on-curing family toxin [Actinopolyspora saharensis]|uniref:type II toxin-antitoxin system death-on-curing family toxin n=1 Tax=Actinopolyspora saharensis TaxID=995062 RepID=UPI003F679390
MSEIDLEALDVVDVLEIARATLTNPPTVRDHGLLESAIERPHTSVFGQDAYPVLHMKAATLLHSSATNHALVDGKKRTAWTTTMVFPELNGHPLVEPLDTDKAEDLVCRTAQHQLSLEEITEALYEFTC